MNWTDLIYLFTGAGVGVVLGRWQRSSRRPAILDAAIPEPATPDSATLAEKLNRMELAYHMATEIGQFKGGFLARISHEIRSPLNGLIGMQQLVLSNLCDNLEEEREFIAQSNESALKMVAVLDSVIEVAKLEHGRSNLEIQPVQLSQLLQDVHTLTHLQARNRNLRLELRAPSPDWYVLADPLQLRQVLVSLIDRALRQMQTGKIALSVHLSSESAQIWIDNSEPECWSEPIDFLQSPAPFPSSGLTFWIDQTLMQQMQGDLKLVAVLPTEKDAGTIAIRLQCSIPLVPIEELDLGEESELDF